MPTLAHRLADFTHRLRFEDLPANVVHEAKRRVIDSLGCALGAIHAEPCAVARRLAADLASTGNGAHLWFTDRRVPPDWAAFANGCLVRYLDYNDTYLSREPAHPSDNIPAAIAIAQVHRATGRQLIAAIAIAYEIQCRLCDAASLRAIGWDHVTYGCFSTALAAGKLMGLSPQQLGHALGIAGVASAALRQTRVGELSHWKGCAFANAARHGTFAALLAGYGMTGPAPIFEGAMGFQKLVSGPLDLPDLDPADCMICRTSIKCWPVEYHAQSAVEAALDLRRQLPPGEPIESVLVHSHDAAVDIIGSEPEKWRPTSRETADHSLPYVVAVALADGQVTAEQFSPQRIADPGLLQLVQRVKVQRSAELSALYPRAVANEVTVRAGGRTFTRRVDYPSGHSLNPMSDAAVETKFHALADGVLTADGANGVLRWVWTLEERRDMGELPGLIRVPSLAAGG